jgi:hypothetical protein
MELVTEHDGCHYRKHKPMKNVSCELRRKESSEGCERDKSEASPSVDEPVSELMVSGTAVVHSGYATRYY